jgi:hypothetical protein
LRMLRLTNVMSAAPPRLCSQKLIDLCILLL